MRLFDDHLPFFKGNLHCHSTLSDGVLSPEEVKAVYRDLGHDFLAITDHRLLSPSSGMEDGLLVLPGLEMDFNLPGESLHIVGIGMSEEITRADLSRSPQSCINQMRRCGGRAIVAHPAWSLNTLATLSSLQNVTAAEIYNSVSTYPWNVDRADSSSILDIAAAHGAPYRFVASDDSHHYEGEAGRAFTMVQASELTQPALLHALDEGRFYCSQGPTFNQITVEEGHITVSCSPVSTIMFYSDMVWAIGRCVTGSGLTTATYDLTQNPNDRFVRVQIMDQNGKSAWSNPIFPGCDQ